MQFTEKQISAVARVLSDRSAYDCGVHKDDNWQVYGEDYLESAKAALAVLSAAAPQVAVDERAAFEVHITDNGTWPRAAERSVDGEYRLMATAVAWNTWRAATDSFASRAAAPVQAQEPVAHLKFWAAQSWSGNGNHDIDCGEGLEVCEAGEIGADKLPAFPVYRAPVQPVAVPDASITLTGHQLRMALDLINPGGHQEREELDDDLTFGVRQHSADDETVSIGLCCWNDDTDGVLPLDGEYEAPVPRTTAPAMAVPDGWQATDDEIAAWATRHDLHISSATDRRAVFEDAESLRPSIAAPAAQGDTEGLKIKEFGTVTVVDDSLVLSNFVFDCEYKQFKTKDEMCAAAIYGVADFIKNRATRQSSIDAPIASKATS